MAKTRDVLKHVDVAVASGRRKCHHRPKKHSIARGEACLTVRATSYNSSKNYCTECAAPILALARDRLEDLARQLGVE